MKYSCDLIGKCYKFGETRSMFKHVQKMKKLCKSVKTHVKFKAQIHRIRFCKSLTEEIFESAWDITYQKLKKDASVEVQRIWRGHLDVMRNFKRSAQLRTKIKQKIEAVMATKIQKFVRGYIVRVRMDRLQRAAYFIQGYLRGKIMQKYRMRSGKCAKV